MTCKENMIERERERMDEQELTWCVEKMSQRTKTNIDHALSAGKSGDVILTLIAVTD